MRHHLLWDGSDIVQQHVERYSGDVSHGLARLPVQKKNQPVMNAPFAQELRGGIPARPERATYRQLAEGDHQNAKTPHTA